MSHDTAHLLHEALSLPPEARASLAASLIESLDELIAASDDPEWSAELARRLRELGEGKVVGLPWDDMGKAGPKP